MAFSGRGNLITLSMAELKLRYVISMVNNMINVSLFLSALHKPKAYLPLPITPIINFIIHISLNAIVNFVASIKIYNTIK